MAEVNNAGKIRLLPTPQVPGPEEGLTPLPTEILKSGRHLGVDGRVQSDWKEHCAEVAKASIDHFNQMTTVHALDTLRKAPVFTTEDDGTEVLVKFGRRGEVIYPAEETLGETSGAA